MSSNDPNDSPGQPGLTGNTDSFFGNMNSFTFDGEVPGLAEKMARAAASSNNNNSFFGNKGSFCAVRTPHSISREQSSGPQCRRSLSNTETHGAKKSRSSPVYHDPLDGKGTSQGYCEHHWKRHLSDLSASGTRTLEELVVMLPVHSRGRRSKDELLKEAQSHFDTESGEFKPWRVMSALRYSPVDRSGQVDRSSQVDRMSLSRMGQMWKSATEKYKTLNRLSKVEPTASETVTCYYDDDPAEDALSVDA